MRTRWRRGLCGSRGCSGLLSLLLRSLLLAMLGAHLLLLCVALLLHLALVADLLITRLLGLCLLTLRSFLARALVALLLFLLLAHAWVACRRNGLRRLWCHHGLRSHCGLHGRDRLHCNRSLRSHGSLRRAVRALVTPVIPALFAPTAPPIRTVEAKAAVARWRSGIGCCWRRWLIQHRCGW